MQAIKQMCCRAINKRFAKMIAYLIICSAVISTLSGAAIAKYQVSVVDGENIIYIYTSNSEPEKILASNKIVLNAEDNYEFSGFENNRATIDINRAFDVKILADSNEHVVRMATGTVADALQKANIVLSSDDLVNTSLEEKVFEGSVITINRVTYDEVQKTTVIPFETDKVRTPTIRKGVTKPISDGVNGEMLAKTKRTFIDGVVVETELISEEVTKKPINARVYVGDPSAPASVLTPPSSLELDANGNPTNFKSKYQGKATAYSSLGRRTNLVPGNVAMNLSQFPRGTKLYIKAKDGSFNYGYSVVKDTGGAVNEGRILVDLFFNSYAESCYFGAKTVDVYVLN
ncbi:MAG: G5 domain-containing protein [Oscillospiraceae bacterium]